MPMAASFPQPSLFPSSTGLDDAAYGCATMTINPEQTDELGGMFKTWRGDYWMPLKTNREFAAHFSKPNAGAGSCMRSGWPFGASCAWRIPSKLPSRRYRCLRRPPRMRLGCLDTSSAVLLLTLGGAALLRL